MNKKIDPIKNKPLQGENITRLLSEAIFNGTRIYTDGSSLGNPGPGGWGVIIITNDKLLITNDGHNKKEEEFPISDDELLITNDGHNKKGEKFPITKDKPARKQGGLLITNDENPNTKHQKPNTKLIELGGHEKHTTNNRMELTAVIEALKYLCIRQGLAEEELRKSDFLSWGEVEIHTDSAYVLGGVTSWVKNWERNGWRTSDKKQVLNQDLWQELISLQRSFGGKISWQKVKGHSGHIYNDRADEIATQNALLQRKYVL